MFNGHSKEPTHQLLQARNRLHTPRVGQVCVFITAGPITKLFAWGEGDSGGHVLRETTSRGLRQAAGHLKKTIILNALQPFSAPWASRLFFPRP